MDECSPSFWLVWIYLAKGAGGDRGPDAVRQQLEELPSSQREDVVRGVSDSGYPASETLEDFRALVAEPILNAPSRLRTVRNAPVRRPRRGKRRGR